MQKERLVIKILYRIEKEKEIKRLRLRCAILGLLLFATLVSGEVMAKNISNEPLKKSFIAYTSLLASDFDFVVKEWQNFLWALIESFPFYDFAFIFLQLSVFLFLSAKITLIIKKLFFELKLNGDLKNERV